jgi:hypothetical protein
MHVGVEHVAQGVQVNKLAHLPEVKFEEGLA